MHEKMRKIEELAGNADEALQEYFPNLEIALSAEILECLETGIRAVQEIERIAQGVDTPDEYMPKYPVKMIQLEGLSAIERWRKAKEAAREAAALYLTEKEMAEFRRSLRGVFTAQGTP